ncbi:MAG TPA: FAD-dependent monooxygenase [Thermoanaerobaculia bacterium]|nr:FAD-dependent monooxygenase [Thermoanaerobaculia bacterium]
MAVRSSSQHRQDSAGSGRHAVVVGGSIGGMLAARVLSDHFDRITLIERDHLPEGTANRPGVPQARHLHFFLKRGLMAVEELFPGVQSDLLAAGSHLLDQGKDFRILYRSGWSPKVACDLEICAFTRPLLETTIRRHLLQNPKVSITEGREVAGLVLDESGERVEGVRLRQRDAEAGGEETTLRADFVVDVSGRGSKAPEWLQALGYDAPEEEVVDAFWGYATRIYEPVEGFSADWKSLFILNRPPYQPRAGIIQPIEGNRWIVTVAGVMHDYPPTDEEGFLKFARSLSSPELYRAIESARPLSKIWGYRQTANRLRHYEKLSRMPQGFVTLGDAVCSFNPVYALGMTLTCLAVLELRDSLRKGRGQVETLRFQKRLARLAASSWALTTSEDLRWPETQGGRITPKVKLMHWYLEQVIQLLPKSEEVFRRFQEVNHMLKPSSALFHPAVLGAVLRQAFGGRRAFPKPQEAPARNRRHSTTTTATVPIRH